MENKIRNRMTKLSSSFPSNIQVPWGPNFGSARLYGIYIYIYIARFYCLQRKGMD